MFLMREVPLNLPEIRNDQDAARVLVQGVYGVLTGGRVCYRV